MLLAFRPSENVGLFFGPQIGFLAAATQKSELDGETEEADISNFINDTDVSAVVGVFVPVSERVWFDLRYQFGLTNFVDVGNARASNNCFQISILAPLTPYLARRGSTSTAE